MVKTLKNSKKWQFEGQLQIIGINPYVSLPENVLADLLEKIPVVRGKIPLLVHVNNQGPFQQTLLVYQGAWRLYINQVMLKNSPKRIGEYLNITIERDHSDRTLPLHPELKKALEADPEALSIFQTLIPSLQHEINRYITALKTPASVEKNVQKAILFLKGHGRFVGRSQIILKK